MLRLLLGVTVLLLLLCPQAVRSDCSLPPDVPNAQPDLEGRTSFPEGSTVTYKCNKDFVKVPGKIATITCIKDNEWSSIAEFCNRKFFLSFYKNYENGMCLFMRMECVLSNFTPLWSDV
ncbi:PREDICTED: complement decay-accelerating factor-like [Hipposideros armiger]|uniref:Complement decay-accelerating factor-like n=1 Tax=Hipposideros armiger TaxID=186990 RepID=A0A8B7QPS5_HIPAR|nr:PREDICTED: complement decay-accelerating factor-like [Hipposideros armiger]